MLEKMVMDSFISKTGLVIRVRPLLAEDAPYLVDLFEHMSAESRYSRFLQPVENIDIERVWTEAEAIAEQTKSANQGLIAFADLPDRDSIPVSAARYVKLSDVQAEIAVSVRDDMQNMGIGAHLLQLLIAEAGAQGIEQLIGMVQNSNTPMWAILSNLGHRLERQPEGSYSHITLHIHESGSRVDDWLDAAADYSPEPQIVW